MSATELLFYACVFNQQNVSNNNIYWHQHRERERVSGREQEQKTEDHHIEIWKVSSLKSCECCTYIAKMIINTHTHTQRIWGRGTYIYVLPYTYLHCICLMGHTYTHNIRLNRRRFCWSLSSSPPPPPPPQPHYSWQTWHIIFGLVRFFFRSNIFFLYFINRHQCCGVTARRRGGDNGRLLILRVRNEEWSLLRAL